MIPASHIGCFMAMASGIDCNILQPFYDKIRFKLLDEQLQQVTQFCIKYSSALDHKCGSRVRNKDMQKLQWNKCSSLKFKLPSLEWHKWKKLGINMNQVWNDILCKPIELAMPRLSPWLRPAEGRAWTVHALATSWTCCSSALQCPYQANHLWNRLYIL